MPEVRRLRKRGATIEVVAFGEILFAPGADVSRFLQRFSAKVRDFAAQEAPVNKRPRWKHYGKPLKETMRARTQLRRGASVFHLHSAVGSTAPHAYYVDQGTGVYNGSGPYPAKVLPPWTHGSPSLYENTWRPNFPENENARKVRQVYIKGQKGQHFFDKALDRGFAFMRLSAFQRPGEGVGGVSGVLRTEPAGLADFLGNTPGGEGSAFEASLEEWRLWRDEAWNGRRQLGQHGGLRHRLSKFNTVRFTRAQSRKHDLVKHERDNHHAREHILAARGLRTRAERERIAREDAKILAAASREKARQKRLNEAEAKAQAAVRTDKIKRLSMESNNLAQRYANAGYTVRRSTDFNADHTEIIGYTVRFTSPTGTKNKQVFH